MTEVPYQPTRGEGTYRLVIRRQQIEESRQGELFKIFRYRYVLTNLPRSYSTEAVIRLTYQRCDQEKIIEQLQHGIAAMRMPTGSFLANAAFLTCAKLAFYFKAWLAQLALPPEVLRWEWKRFLRSFVYVAARIVRSARQIKVGFAKSICSAVTKVQTLSLFSVIKECAAAAPWHALALLIANRAGKPWVIPATPSRHCGNAVGFSSRSGIKQLSSSVNTNTAPCRILFTIYGLGMLAA